MRRVSGLALRATSWLVILAAVLGVLGLAVLMVGPRLLGWHGAIVLTGSMEPALKVGGVAFIEPSTDAASVQVGEIITYKSLKDPRKRISHRVIDIVEKEDGLFFQTKGDNSELPDQQPVPASNLVGKVRLHVPYLGYAADKLRHKSNFYLFVGLPAGLLITNELINIFRELRKLRSATARP